MTEITVSPDKIEFNDPPRIEWVRVKDVLSKLWVDNPKLHDIGMVCESIARYGYQELPKFDANLKAVDGSMGAWKAGNGRIEALARMEQDRQYKERFPTGPRGCGVDEEGDWVCPAIFGVDADSEIQAESYAIDSNNLVMTGGDFTVFDYLRMWDPSKLIEESLSLFKENQLPLTISEADLELLSQAFDQGESDFLESFLEVERAKPDPVDIESDWVTLEVVMPADVKKRVLSKLNELRAAHDCDKLFEALVKGLGLD